MNTPQLGVSRRGLSVFSLAAVLVAIVFSGCATIVKVDSSPAGAAVTADGKPIGITPTQYQVENAQKPVTMAFSLPGYFPEAITYVAGGNPAPVYATLEPTKLAKSFEIISEPAGATVTLDGKTVGVTPMTLPVEFVRPSKRSPWIAQRVTLSKPDYQSEGFVLTSDTGAVAPTQLSLLRDDRLYTISAVNLDGSPLDANVILDGKPIGHTPLQLPIVYRRSDKSQPWPKYVVTVDMPGKYKLQTIELSYPRETTIPLRLEAITEIAARIYSPEVVMTPVGAALALTERSTVATLRTSDDSTSITDLKQVTKFDRQDMRPANRIETISSFTLTPDGQSVIFALCDADETGTRFSNLFIKRADDAAGGVSRLTTSPRYFDTQPYIANDGSNFLVFTSNRGDRAKTDIFRVTFTEGNLVGGISRLTNDNRFNYGPTYGDSNRQLFYLSVEPAFPKAEVQISSIRFDGSLPTQLPIAGENINNTHPDKIYFVKIDPELKNKQIYSITPDGKLETAIINSEDFKKANCFQPHVSADGRRLLFVSDHVGDARDRVNNDIYVVNTDGTNLQRLTYNESDDTLPMWSPTEEGVVYFRSTRGGATNIWRFKLTSGH